VHLCSKQRSRWAGCFSGLSCFGSQKGGKRIVPAARTPDGNGSTARGNGHQSGSNLNQNVPLNLSLLAPPSSPASFSNSALPSTVQSPNNFLSISANSPGGPTSNMFAVGPYANEPQLVSPPVFSTYTTEPSTAPLTPPPELAHATTPSSPDVPYARFLSSSMDIKTASKEHNIHFLSTTYSGGSGLQASYPLYPESPCSSLISPASATPRTGLSSPIPEQEVPTAHWKTSRSACDTPYSRASPVPEQEATAQWKTSRSACDTPNARASPSNIFGLGSSAHRNYLLDGNFFRPAASAQFHLDQAQQTYPYNGGRRSVSRDKQDADEVEAYRASFGFSADEIMQTQSYVEIPDALDESFSISPFGNSVPATEMSLFNDLPNEVKKGVLSVKDVTSPTKSADQISNDSPHRVLHIDIFKGKYPCFLFQPFNFNLVIVELVLWFSLLPIASNKALVNFESTWTLGHLSSAPSCCSYVSIYVNMFIILLCSHFRNKRKTAV
jgi:hypothetical protein